MKCQLVSLQDESEAVEWIEEITCRDPYEVLNDVERLFKKTKIRPASNEELFEACVSEDGEVQGVSTAGLYDSQPMDADPLERPQYSFSVAVLESARRQGIAKALVQSIIHQFPKDACLLMGKVVNPHMARLLESLGFEHLYEKIDESDWSAEDRVVGRVMYRP